MKYLKNKLDLKSLDIFWILKIFRKIILYKLYL